MTQPAIAPSELSNVQYYWEDFEPGFEFESVGRTILSSDVAQFASLSGDYNRLHTNDVYAGQSAFGQRIAHGLLVGSIVSGLTTRTVVNQFLEPSLLGLLEVNFTFPKPTFVNDTIKAVIRVKSRKETSNPTRGIIEFERFGINQHEETVCVCTVKMLVSRRP